VIGNHGAEAAGGNEKARRKVAAWKAVLETELQGLPGLWLEDKGLSLAIHYRQSLRKADALRKIKAATDKLRGAKVFGGKQVMNVTPGDARHKGDALAAERDRLGCDWALFVGDDENDESVFAMTGDIISVRIVLKRKSHALYYLRSQAEIDRLLRQLVDLRSGESRSRPALVPALRSTGG
jgi:trehalose 6-phosphate phosphatase